MYQTLPWKRASTRHNISPQHLKNSQAIHPESSEKIVFQHRGFLMNNIECILTVEIGTNAVRVMAFDLTGNVIGSMKGSYPTFHTEPDYSEQDPDQMFITMLYVMKNLINEKIHPAHYKVTSICFSASMHSVLPIDKHGVPLGNAITWADNRGKREAQQ